MTHKATSRGQINPARFHTVCEAGNEQIWLFSSAKLLWYEAQDQLDAGFVSLAYTHIFDK
jgi:hypothetical protein